ncbi:SPL family radical SAM protein [Acetobacterium bakii]|uniref:Radical SAM protein n=1 Tax=Acetobacterium bakii TaxID=52689 RepID=A0A0L6U0E5_9FIRM|nr:radical SAM protein [Acetobacterium bakii]KNZ41974.1 radical SAM protein [Acetobacterium bakii]
MEYIPAKNIVTRTKGTAWFGTEYNMNIYKGCSHGCIYCDSRSDCYRIEDFDRVRAKENALAVIRDNLSRKMKKGVVGTGAMSDPYNPFEKELQLTRHALEIIRTHGFGVAIATKSPLITRDIDVLNDIRKRSPVIVKMTITTADDALCKKIEPHVPVSSERFQAIKELSDHGIYCGILLMPILPFINDTQENILEIVRRGKENGAGFIYPCFGVTLRDKQREYFYDQLDQHFPTIKQKYMLEFGNQYNCSSPNAKALYANFTKECNRLSMLYKMSDIISRYKIEQRDTQLTFI